MNDGIGIMGVYVYDHIKYIDRYPKKSELTPILREEVWTGGVVGNCLAAFKRIDPKCPIEIITILGEDSRGDYLYQKLLEYENVDVSQVLRRGKTAYTDAMTDMNDKTRTFFTYTGASRDIDVDTIDFKKFDSKILHVAYILILESLDKEDMEYGTRMGRLLYKAQQRGIKTSIDVVSENSNRYRDKVYPVLRYTNYCIINETEAGRTVGIELRDFNNNLRVQEIKSVLKALKEAGVKDWVIIHSPEGAFGYDGKVYISLPSLKLSREEILGTVGAGDAFAAGVLYGAKEELSMREAMKLGISSAACVLLGENMEYGDLLKMYEKREKNQMVNI